MKKSTLIVVFLLINMMTATLFAQSFKLTNLTAANFPTVRASFIALNEFGKSYRDLTVNDFTVVDNGKLYLPKDLTLTCDEPPLSIVLVVDQSGSMTENQPPEDNNWVWSKEAIRYFLEAVVMVPGSSVALTTFGNLAYQRSNFLTDQQNYKKIIMDSLTSTSIGGGTNFNRAFFGDPINLPFENGMDSPINLLKNSNPESRRIIVFLTDGQHDLNNGPVLIDSIANSLARYNIQCYGITLKDNISRELQTISEASGGKYYRVDNKLDLQNIYSQIAENISTTIMCQLEWIGEPACDDMGTFHEARINFEKLNLYEKKSYRMPKESISSLEPNVNILAFSDVPINNFERKTLKIYARNSDFVINDFQVLPSTYFNIVDWGDGTGFKPTKGVVLRKNDSLTLTIEFRQLGAQDFRKASLMLKSEPCNADILLAGGVSQIELIKPAGGELFSTCDSISIIWAGVPADAQVEIEYSRDNGVSWVTISNNAKGNSYKWLPPVAGDKFLIRVSTVPNYNYKWSLGQGGTGKDKATSVAAVKNSVYIYATGYFENTAEFGAVPYSSTVASRGGSDIFLGKYDQDGNLVWLETAGSTANDLASGVAVSSFGNAYIVGTCYSPTNFGSLDIVPEFPATPYFFIAQYDKNGGTPLVRFFGAEGDYNTAKLYGTSIYIDEANERIYARGTYTGGLQIPSIDLYLPTAKFSTKFTAIFNLNMDAISVQPGWDSSKDKYFSKAWDTDDQNTIYSVGGFSPDITFGNNKLISKGNTDIFINKASSAPKSNDQMKSTFSVAAPMVVFKQDTFDLGAAVSGSFNTKTFSGTLYNSGLFAVEIENIVFSDTNKIFNVTNNLIGTIIIPGESIDVTYTFSPQNIGNFATQVEIQMSCNTFSFATLLGAGDCGGTAIDLDFGKLTKNSSVKKAETCIFHNSSSVDLKVNPILASANQVHKRMFKLFKTGTQQELKWNDTFIVQPDSCLSLDVVYTPTNIDIHLAQINYQMPAGCQSVFSQLKGESYDTDVSGAPVHWGSRRLAKSFDSVAVIKNNTDQLAYIKVQNVKLAGNSVAGIFSFNLDNITDNYIIIQPFGEFEIPISFTPQQDNPDKYYLDTLIVQVEYRDQPLKMELSGNGFSPQIETVFTCGDDIKAGESGIGQLTVKNTSKYSPLSINSISITQRDDYKLVNISDADARVLQPESSIIIPILFTPNAPGYRYDLIQIENDAYDANFANRWLVTTQELKCSSLGINYTKEVQFGTNYICSQNSREISIENLSGNSDLIIYKDQAYFTNNNDNAFALDLANDLIVPAGTSAKINVTFSPKQSGDFAAVLKLPNSIGYDISILLEAKSEQINITLPQSNIDIIPGKTTKLLINGEMGNIDAGTINELQIVVNYDYQMLDFIINTVKSNISGWTWNADFSEHGKIIFTGSGSLATPFNGELLSIDFTAYLSETTKSSVNYEVVFPCLTQKSATPLEISLTGVCFLEGRLIKISNTKFAISIIQTNELSSKIDVDYAVGFEVETKIELYNSLGILVKTLVDEVEQTGSYNKSFSTADLNAGVYLIRMTSGPFSEVKKIIIKR